MHDILMGDVCFPDGFQMDCTDFITINLRKKLPVHGVGAIMAWSVLQVIVCRADLKKSLIFSKLIQFSMPMFLFHQQIIYFTVLYLNGKLNPWLHVGLNFIVSIIGSYIISAFLMRWKTTRILIGEK